MKRIAISIFLFTLVFCACSVLIDDPSKIEGDWQLTGASFYTYNETFDAYKEYSGISGSIPGADSPLVTEFFDGTPGASYSFIFKRDGNFRVEETISSTTSLFVTPEERCVWSINSFQSSFTLKISDATPDANFWKDGFSFTTYWPLTDMDTMELMIYARDLGMNRMTVDLSNDTLEVISMKGIFTRQ